MNAIWLTAAVTAAAVIVGLIAARGNRALQLGLLATFLLGGVSALVITLYTRDYGFSIYVGIAAVLAAVLSCLTGYLLHKTISRCERRKQRQAGQEDMERE
ncbi:hypothetical protein [Christensenella intestinihominis]|uniref:hypothetical protein n=1 Tax=Christensenella intestinihominis TaxID=1851429 RepID=UPI000835150B|nr:hypothetical protein [Christensenella intestinihominis]